MDAAWTLLVRVLLGLWLLAEAWLKVSGGAQREEATGQALLDTATPVVELQALYGRGAAPVGVEALS